MTAVNIFLERDHELRPFERFCLSCLMQRPFHRQRTFYPCGKIFRTALDCRHVLSPGEIGSSFDEVTDGLSEALQKVKAHLANSVFWIVGFSEKWGNMRAYLWSHDSVNGLPPFTRIPFEEVVMPKPMDASLADGKNPIALLESQRSNPNPGSYFSGCAAVGGFVQETIVAKEGSKTRIIHRWPDKVGEKISD